MRHVSRICYKPLCLIAAVLLALSFSARAQDTETDSSSSDKRGSVAVAADLVSRYVWRGSDFGNSASIQPSLSFSLSGLTAGAWASYPLAFGSAEYDELDFWLSYAAVTKAGTFTPGIGDYTFPYTEKSFSNFDSHGEGAHTIELSLGYTGPDRFPLKVLASVNVHNDGDNSPYLELGYPVTLNDVSLSFFAGAAKGTSAWYGITTNKVEVINVGLTASKPVAITEKFSLPVSASLVINAYSKKAFLVFKASL